MFRTTRHISQGAASLLDERWDAGNNTPLRREHFGFVGGIGLEKHLRIVDKGGPCFTVLAERSSTMPYVTDDDSKAARRITEIERQLQEAKAEFERWLAAGGTPTSAAELSQREREGKTLTDRLQALATALELQRALASAGVAPAGAEAGQSLAQEDEGLRLSAGDGAVSGRSGGGTDGPLLVPQSSPCRQGQRELLRPGAVGRVRPHDAGLGQRGGPACRGLEFVRGRPGPAAADGGQHVDPADRQRGVSFCPAGAEPAGTGRHGHRGIAGRASGW